MDEWSAWVASGCAHLCGMADGEPLGPPAGFIAKLASIARLLGGTRAESGGALPLLVERASAMGLSRQGQTSAGGATRLLRCADGWAALTLARDDDVAALPALLREEALEGEAWEVLTDRVATMSVAALEDRAAMLGIPAGTLPIEPWRPALGVGPLAGLPLRARQFDSGYASPPVEPLVIVELASLWAGPLCGALLVDTGATVVKVESTTRPDGARRGNRWFFDRVNGGKLGVALDLRSPVGVSALSTMLASADVVIESSRPRALEQLGIQPERMMEEHPIHVWLSITGHGRSTLAANRVGFGDDAAVAGGLVCWSGAPDPQPVFCLDAVADPLSGIVAAAAVRSAVDAGTRWHIDISMADVAAHFAGPTVTGTPGGPAPLPPLPVARDRAPLFGEHTATAMEMLRHRRG